jgi:GGDEF domain-containing protein/CHASE3 domain sensor protein
MNVALPPSDMNNPSSSLILDWLVPSRLFARMSIASKMLLGYMTLVVLTVIVVVYALVNLQRMNNLNRSIVKIDIVVKETSDKMVDSLLAQDTYEKRFVILKSPEMISLFKKRDRQFKALLVALQNLPEESDLSLEEIEKLHASYTELFSQEVKLIQKNNVGKAIDLSNNEMKMVLDKLVGSLRALSSEAKDAQERKMEQINAIGSMALLTTSILCLISIVAGAVTGLVVTHHISSSLQKLKIATNHISEGNFDYDPGIKTDDEIGRLSGAFLAMGKRLRKLEEMYLDASPLTRLPGGIAIENVLKKRLESGLPIAFCVIDIDNFKAFNDRYGYANGSEVLKATGKLIENAVKSKGGADDFIGHVGGDDFVVITTPGRMRDISSEITGAFDKRIPLFYEPSDRDRGYIQGKTRQGVEMQFPIMTISIAIVTNERRVLMNPLEASEIAAELKDYAKTIPGSIFVVDKRRGG